MQVNDCFKFLNVTIRIKINTNTVLHTSISTNVCKGLSIILTTASN